MLKSKIHRAIVTESNLDYVGSLTLGFALAEAADILAGELVHVTNIHTGDHWFTYAIIDREHPDSVCMNGTAARHFHPGDPVIILAYGHYTEQEVQAGVTAQLVYVDSTNQILRVAGSESAFTQG